MHRRKVDRLLLADTTGRLRGIVVAADLLKIYSRLDSAIRDDVAERVLRRTLQVGPDQVRVHVEDGVVTLTGRPSGRTSSAVAVALAQASPA
jgi:osmotically-inducible protein OsmY